VSYKYYPEAQTLFDAHLKMGGQKVYHPLPERVIWSYFIQLVNAIKAVHDAGLAVRVIDATKVMVTDENRLVELQSSFLE
jgi:PAB-dependent poly(A)-specific ribonuclease subunit 3